MRIVYLHGFASGPQSRKARFFRDRWLSRSVDVTVPDLAEGHFRELTISGQLRVIKQAVGGEPAVLVGSSLGGYLAALFAARHPAQVEKLVLLAPAFAFPRRWSAEMDPARLRTWRETGTLMVHHYASGTEQPVGYQLVEDAQQYEDYPLVRQPTLILHGDQDTVVPLALSESFVEHSPQALLRRLHTDHEMTGALDEIGAESDRFLGVGGAGYGNT